MERADSLENILMMGKLRAREGDDRGGFHWMVSLTQWILVGANSRRR